MAGIGSAAQDEEQPQGAMQQQPDPQGPDGDEQGQGGPNDQDGDEQGGDEQPNVTPEEQAQYDQFVTTGMRLIYQNNKVTPAVLDQLRGHWDAVKPSLGQIPQEEKPLDPSVPIDNLAVATVALVLAVEAQAAHDGTKYDPAVVFHGGAELMEQLADIAHAGNIHDFTPDEMTGAANRGAMLYGVSSKTMDKQEALAEFDHFLQTQGENLGQSLGAIGQQGQQADQAQGQQQPQNPQEQ